MYGMSVCGTVYDRFLFLYIYGRCTISSRNTCPDPFWSVDIILLQRRNSKLSATKRPLNASFLFFLAGYRARTLNWVFFCFLRLLNVLSVDRIPNIVTFALGIFSKRSPLMQSHATVVLNSGKIKKIYIE